MEPAHLKGGSNFQMRMLLIGSGESEFVRGFRLVNPKSAPLPYNEGRTLHGNFPGANFQSFRIFFR